MSSSLHKKLLKRIYGKKSGWVFTPGQFLDLGSRDAVDKSLQRLANRGTIRRLSRGLYDYPKRHLKLGMLSPNPDAIADCISQKDSSRLQPSGAYAVNLLGLSQQVPAKIVYLTDGTNKSLVIGKQQIQLRNTTPKNMKTAGCVSGLVIQAFRYLGKNSISPKVIATLQRSLSANDRAQVWKNRIYAPAWMHAHFKQIHQGDT